MLPGYSTKVPGTTFFSQFPLWDFFECNRFIGASPRGPSSGSPSQFPLWDFFECNLEQGRLSEFHKTTHLSIPFVGFLRMQQLTPYQTSTHTIKPNPSQFPLWDFFECNLEFLGMLAVANICSLNSLCGISSNATRVFNLSQLPRVSLSLNSLCGISSNATVSW